MHVVATKVSADIPPRDDEGSYSFREVSRLLALPEHRLRYWSQTGFLVPSVRRGERRFYSFRDLIAVKVAKGLLDGGLPLRRVRRQLEALRVNLPRVQAPLHELRIRCEDDRVVVDDIAHRFEASSGQLMLDFEVSTLHEEAAQVLALPWVDEDGQPLDRAPETAHEWFLYAQELEEEWGGSPADTEGLSRVRHAYETALELDPKLAAAWTNLGGLLAEIGHFEEAEEHFEEALRHDPDQMQAKLNIAELQALRDGPMAALPAYREILRRDPDCHEAHYGVARALLGQGRKGKGEALAHLERFRTAVDKLDDDERNPELIARRTQVQTVIETLRTELGR